MKIVKNTNTRTAVVAFIAVAGFLTWLDIEGTYAALPPEVSGVEVYVKLVIFLLTLTAFVYSTFPSVKRFLGKWTAWVFVVLFAVCGVSHMVRASNLVRGGGLPAYIVDPSILDGVVRVAMDYFAPSLVLIGTLWVAVVSSRVFIGSLVTHRQSGQSVPGRTVTLVSLLFVLLMIAFTPRLFDSHILLKLSNLITISGVVLMVTILLIVINLFLSRVFPNMFGDG